MPQKTYGDNVRQVSVDTFCMGKTLATLGKIKTRFNSYMPYRNEIGECATTPS